MNVCWPWMKFKNSYPRVLFPPTPTHPTVPWPKPLHTYFFRHRRQPSPHRPTSAYRPAPPPTVAWPPRAPSTRHSTGASHPCTGSPPRVTQHRLHHRPTALGHRRPSPTPAWCCLHRRPVAPSRLRPPPSTTVGPPSTAAGHQRFFFKFTLNVTKFGLKIDIQFDWNWLDLLMLEWNWLNLNMLEWNWLDLIMLEINLVKLGLIWLCCMKFDYVILSLSEICLCYIELDWNLNYFDYATKIWI
jgi:hypothetical protein